MVAENFIVFFIQQNIIIYRERESFIYLFLTVERSCVSLFPFLITIQKNSFDVSKNI